MYVFVQTGILLKKSVMKPVYYNLRIYEEKTLAAIGHYLEGLVGANERRGTVLGLSGGIDSALLATLLVRIYGPEWVHGVYLYDQDSDSRLAVNARSLAENLGIRFSTRSIEPEMRVQGIYHPLPMRITRRWAILNRFLYRLYTILAGESPFMTTLRIGSAEMDEMDSRYKFYRNAYKATEKAFNTRHIFRRRILEQLAEESNAILLGAANRSEWKIGWFVKDGVDDVAHQPLKGLYKTQIRQLSEYLSLPSQIRIQKPSPDMRKGITDEFAIGMSYQQLDILLDHLQSGKDRAILNKEGLDERRLATVRELNRLSAWKRGENEVIFPVDGGPGSDLRVVAHMSI